MEDVEKAYAPQAAIDVEKEKELKELLAGDPEIVDQKEGVETEICEEEPGDQSAPDGKQIL